MVVAGERMDVSAAKIPRAIAGRFLSSAQRTAGSEGEDAIEIIPADGAPPPQSPRGAPRSTSNAAPRARPSGPPRQQRYQARPTNGPRR